MRAESLNLVGAAMAVRIEQDGNVTVFAGADKRPIATASVPPLLRRRSSAARRRSALLGVRHGTARGRGSLDRSTCAGAGSPPHQTSDAFAALLSWIDGIGETGLDGHDLRELGLKDGNVTVDDERTGKRWTFQNISLSIERPHGGGVVVTVGSDNPERRWGLTASITPSRQRLPHHSAGRPPSFCERPSVGGSAWRRKPANKLAAVGKLARRNRPGRRAAIAGPAASSPMPDSSATATAPTAALISIVPNSSSIGTPQTAPCRSRSKFFPAATGSR